MLPKLVENASVWGIHVYLAWWRTGQSCTTLVQVQGNDVPVLVYDSQLPVHEA
jgi:hypothetical protein